MSDDIRVSVGFLSHHKTKMLIRRHGYEGVVRLLALWAFCRQNKPTGRLEGMTAEEIEVVVDWSGEEGAFVVTLLDLKWLDQDEECFVVHDWHDHNPYAASSEERSDRARFSRLAQIDKGLHKQLKARGVTKISAKDLAELCNRQPNVGETPAERKRNASPVSVSDSDSVPQHSLSDSDSKTLSPPQPKGEKPVAVAGENPISLEELRTLYCHFHGEPSLDQQKDLIHIADHFTSEAIVEAVEKSEGKDKNPAGWIKERLERKDRGYLPGKDPFFLQLDKLAGGDIEGVQEA